MPLTSKDIVPISQARTHLAELADDVATNHNAKMLTRNGESLVALISAADFDELQRFRQADHLRDLRRIVEAMRELDSKQGMGLEDFDAEVHARMDWVDAPDGEPLPQAARGKPAVKKAQTQRSVRSAKSR